MDYKGKYYLDGYKNGYLERYAGLPLSVISSTYPDHCLPGYAKGYIAGWYDCARGKDPEPYPTRQDN